MPSSPEDATASMIRNMPEKTGKSLEQWVALAKKSGHAKHGQIVSFLKTEYALGHGYANLVALTALGSSVMNRGEGAGDALILAQYGGAKAELRPIYESLIAKISAFGKDVEVSPKKTYVSLRRNKQFALIQPTTATRIDVGINLKGTAPTDRLEASGSFNSMVSHRVRVASAKDVDKELIGWLKKAYEAS